MKIKKVSALVCGAFALYLGAANIASASELPDAGAISSGFNLGGASLGIVTRYHVTETTALGLTIELSTFDRETTSDSPSVYSYSENSNSFVGFQPGLRFYFSDSGPLWFSEVAGSLRYVKTDSAFYRDSDSFGTTESFSNLSGWEYGLNLYVGMEEFVTDNISIEARIGWGINYRDLEGDGNDNATESSSETTTGTNSLLGANFYW